MGTTPELRSPANVKAIMKRAAVRAIVSVAALGVIAAIVPLLPRDDTGRRSPELRLITQVGAALQQFNLDLGRYPTEAEGLNALMVAPVGAKGWRSPYLENPPGVDSWGHPLFYRIRPDGQFELGSYGSDGKPGGEGDAADIDPYRLDPEPVILTKPHRTRAERGAHAPAPLA